MKKIWRVVSLFDGISIARQALKNAGIPAEYHASEIDKYAIQVSKRNHADVYHLGDVRNVKDFHAVHIDLLIGGSPCQDLSCGGQGRKGLRGERSGLFFEFARVLNEANPRFFIFENVASMTTANRDAISKELRNIQPQEINAVTFGAQWRRRLFWVGRWTGQDYETVQIKLPEPSPLVVADILEPIDRPPLYPFPADETKEKSGRPILLRGGAQSYRVFSTLGKSTTLVAASGGPGSGGGLYAIKDFCRALSPVEWERLMGLPDDYTKGLSKTRRKMLIGNGFHCGIIQYIVEAIYG